MNLAAPPEKRPSPAASIAFSCSTTAAVGGLSASCGTRSAATILFPKNSPPSPALIRNNWICERLSLFPAAASVHSKFRPNELLDSFFPRHSQTNQLAFVFQINVKIKEGAALAFRQHPVRQFRKRHVLRTELEFVPLLGLDDFLSCRHQLLAQLLVVCALFRRQRFGVAKKLAVRRCHLLLCLSSFRRGLSCQPCCS